MDFRLAVPILAAALAVCPGGAALAGETKDDAMDEAKPELTRATICALIDQAAASHDLPVEFFTRLIWQESRFRQDAVSPKGAQGIAQFMPGTAALRNLADPFDAAEAIGAS